MRPPSRRGRENSSRQSKRVASGGSPTLGPPLCSIIPLYQGSAVPKSHSLLAPCTKELHSRQQPALQSIDDTSFPRKSVHCELCFLPGASATTRPVAAGVPEDQGCFLEKRQAGGSARCVADEIPRHAGDGNITLTSMDSPQWTIKFIW